MDKALASYMNAHFLPSAIFVPHQLIYLIFLKLYQQSFPILATSDSAWNFECLELL